MRRKLKWIATLLAAVFFLLLGSVIPDDDLGDRAMAVALGLDVDEENNVVACAQIVTPADSDGTSAGTRVVTGKGKVLNTALSRITETCGLTLTASHCNVVLLGKKLIESGESLGLVFTLLENTYVNDNAYIFSCEGTPEEVLGSQSAFGNNAGQYLQQLITMYGTYENITYKTIRQVIVGSHDLGKATYMPYLVKEPVRAQIPGSSSFEEIKEKEDYAYNLNHVQVLREGKDAGVYGENALRALNYLLTEVHKGSDDFAIEGGRVGVFILNNDAKHSFSLEEKTYSVDLTIGITVKDVRMDDGREQDNTFSPVLTGENKKMCENQLRDEIVAFYNEMKEKNADVFAVRQKFYSKYGKKAKELSLQDIDFRLNVTFTMEK